MNGLIASFLEETSSKSTSTVDMSGENEGGSSFVTLLTDDSFFPGVTALCKSLRATSSGILLKATLT
jgi:hypothetical protein